MEWRDGKGNVTAEARTRSAQASTTAFLTPRPLSTAADIMFNVATWAFGSEYTVRGIIHLSRNVAMPPLSDIGSILLPHTHVF
jgi:hypothetical protein